MNNQSNFKHCVFDPKYLLAIDFNGLSIDNNTDVDRINTIIKNIFNIDNRHTGIKTVVAYLRTILRDYEEKDLNIRINDLKNNVTAVNFKNKKVTFFKTSKLFTVDSKEFSLEIIYTVNKGIAYSTKPLINSNEEKNYLNHIIHDYINQTIDNVTSLNNTTAINTCLNDNDLFILSTYRLAFNKNLDANNIKNTAEIQAFMYLLNEYIPTFSLKDEFHINSKHNIFSQKIQNSLNKLALLGEINTTLQKVPFETIYAISKLREALSKYNLTYSKSSLIEDAALLLYVSKNIYLSSPKVKNLLKSKYLTCTKEEIELIMDFLEHLNLSLNNSQNKILLK